METDWIEECKEIEDRGILITVERTTKSCGAID
jgi:hypothetical protein